MTKPKFKFPDLYFKGAENFDDDELREMILKTAEKLAKKGVLSPEDYKSCVTYVDWIIFQMREKKQ